MLTNDELELALRLPSIQRWQIVEVSKPQSVADHTFRVWLLATHLWDTLFPVPHNSLDRATLERWALFHDVDEVVTGDIPSTVKQTLNRAVPGAVARLKQAVHEQHFPSIEAMFRGQMNTTVERVVDICDIVEAMLYIRKYGEKPLCDAVFRSLQQRLLGSIEEAGRDERVNEEHIHMWVADRFLTGDAMTRVARGVGVVPVVVAPVVPDIPPPQTIMQQAPVVAPQAIPMPDRVVRYACGCSWELANSPSLSPPDVCLRHLQQQVL